MAAGGIGSQLSQPPISLINTANGVTQKYFQPQLVDAVFKPSPFWWRLTRLGRKFQGGAIVWTLINQEELTGGAFWGTQLLSTDVTDSAQPAELQWRAYNQLCAIPIIDAILNQGPPGVVNLVRVKEEIAFASLLMKLNRAAQRTSPPCSMPTASVALVTKNPRWSLPHRQGGIATGGCSSITNALLKTKRRPEA